MFGTHDTGGSYLAENSGRLLFEREREVTKQGRRLIAEIRSTVNVDSLHVLITKTSGKFLLIYPELRLHETGVQSAVIADFNCTEHGLLYVIDNCCMQIIGSLLNAFHIPLKIITLENYG